MSKPNNWINQCAKNIKSQNGEDVIIEAVLSVIGGNKWCVEFGAWDGEYLSNTYTLINNHEFSAVLIEGDAEKCRLIPETFQGNNKVTAINQFVGTSQDNNLAHLLDGTGIPDDFDFLSIDIDGNDYHVWDAMSKYKPRLVCIEYNMTIPSEVDFVQKNETSVQHGNSILALNRLAQEKGYQLIATTLTNLFFVDEQYFSALEIEDNSIHSLREDLTLVTYLYTGYDGTTFISGNCKVPWHGISYQVESLQQLPKFLRKYPLDYNRFQKKLFKWCKRIRNKFYATKHTNIS
ncbi:MAG: FkbM family methyltransferase [Endozoicomonadaceae bacterium]|nr:FkbM family methyltransferase [Endozoicomonadaceae bacterium]